MANHDIEFDLELIRRYDMSGPRYTSYPTAVQFSEQFTERNYRDCAERSNVSGKPLSLYFHIPFCDTVCFYCGCNKVVTRDRSRAGPYLKRVYKEIEMQSAMFDSNRKVDQLHWGGGTPTFISHDEMSALMDKTRKHFNLHSNDNGEYSIEIDPREVKSETLVLLRKLGFNRMSLGVQDFDDKVQKAVNRIQPKEKTVAVFQEAKDLGFRSINFDLIYGLPHQTVTSFSNTLDQVIDIGPDRLSIFNYAHLPEMFKPQRRISESDLPSPQEKLEILGDTISKLTQAGYVYIGMDHFAKPDDELALAQRQGNLYRNFQGYSTHADCDLVAMGVTSIGKIANCYSQNQKTLDGYYKAIDSRNLAVVRGILLDEDDTLRRTVITELICHFRLEKGDIAKRYGIVFDDYFTQELRALVDMEQDGLIELGPEVLVIKPAGRLLIRNICMVFDRYLKQSQNKQFSRVI